MSLVLYTFLKLGTLFTFFLSWLVFLQSLGIVEKYFEALVLVHWQSHLNVKYAFYLGLMLSGDSAFSHKVRKSGRDQETIQSSTTPDPGYHMGK